MHKRNNPMLITVDCLRADYVFGRRDLTPNINSLINRSITFMNATSVSYCMLPSFIAIFSRTYPSEYGGILSLKLRGSLVTRIRSEGYITIAVYNNPFISRFYGFDEGFEYFYDDLVTTKIIGKDSYLLKIRSFLKEKIKSAFLRRILQKIYRRIAVRKYRKYNLWADEINSIFLNWLRREYKGRYINRSFFAWLHYMDLHAPYLPPLEYLPPDISLEEVIRINQMKDEDLLPERDEIIKLYCASLKYLDNALGELLRELEELGVIHNTYIIITADHGHGFWEHGILGHLSSCLYKELVHVPLIIVGSDIESQKVETPFSLHSIFDIIYELLGIKERLLTVDGRFNEDKYKSIHNVISEGGPVLISHQDINIISFELSEIAVKAKYGNYVYKLIFRLKGQSELYSLTKDPLEKENVIDREVDIAKELYDIVMRHLRRVELMNKVRDEIVRIRKSLSGISNRMQVPTKCS